MQNYYELRDAPEPGVGRPDTDSDDWQVFNSDEMFGAFSEQHGATAIATLYVAGMYCSACSWLIESTLAKTPGVIEAEIDSITHRVRIEFSPQKIGLGDLLAVLASLGYKPQALTPDSELRPELAEQRGALKRLLVASLGMMQVMMFAVALYAGEFQGIDANMQRFLRLVSFLVTTPVVFYSARPFFAGAIRGLRTRRPGMDLPVSIAIASAYLASVYATMTNGAAVWYDSVTMFVFFLTLGRFLEMRARHRSIDRKVALAALLPNTVIRVDGAEHRKIPVSELIAGDRVLIRPGDSIPADGTLCSGESSVDEAVVTGESRPQRKRVGDTLIAGSLNLESSIQLEVRSTGVDTTLGAIGRLSEQARFARPEFVRLADKIASYIVVAILAIAAIVAVTWTLYDPTRTFVITLSVLVVSCPCALALATPAAFAAATSRMSDLRLLVTDANAVEALSRADHIMFDKTGTLTCGRPVIVNTELLDSRYSATDCLRIASALEANSTHPIAMAFSVGKNTKYACDARTFVGNGISGVVDGVEWRLGKQVFVSPMADEDTTLEMSVWLGNDEGAVAKFDLEDGLRPHAKETLNMLQDLGFKLTLLSGDGEIPVKRVADIVAIDNIHYSCTPNDKLEQIRKRQDLGDVVVMVGDGINDAPVLAGADASIAPAHAASLAQTSADIIMLGDSLQPVVTAVRLSQQTMRIVRQNLAWAIVYNLSAVPLAAFGYVPPWLAAVGMSMSSLVVVLNALRLGRFS